MLSTAKSSFLGQVDESLLKQDPGYIFYITDY